MVGCVSFFGFVAFCPFANNFFQKNIMQLILYVLQMKFNPLIAMVNQERVAKNISIKKFWLNNIFTKII